jgi:hypothetical protein
MLTCEFTSHRAACTIAQRSNSTIAAAQDRMAWISLRLALRWQLDPSSRAQPSRRQCTEGIMSSGGDDLRSRSVGPRRQRTVTRGCHPHRAKMSEVLMLLISTVPRTVGHCRALLEATGW